MVPGSKEAAQSPPCTLTLVVPCYNEEHSLTHCIERVWALRSSQLKLEIIIVDDCSKDKSLAIARELAEPHTEVKFFSMR
jgi:glycosyltransferase involved in cell wall biosynthesis